MKCNDNKICVSFDLQTGFTTEIYNPYDEYEMNWILDNSNWGFVEGFDVYKVEKKDRGIEIYAHNERELIDLRIEKSVHNVRYTEKYIITNNSNSDYFFTKDNIGIHFPYNCTFEDKKHLHNNSCITHVWCGGDVSWMYSRKPSGAKPYLVCRVTKGSFSDYSISYDVSRVEVGASYRGSIVLIPTEKVLLQGESVVYELVFEFSENKPDEGELDEYNTIRVTADRYSVFTGEKTNCKLESFNELSEITVICDGKPVEYEKNGNVVMWSLSFETVGEKIVTIYADNKKTFMVLNVLPQLEEILIKRAKFITQKQQYHKPGSKLDGAYLIYDRTTDSLYYNERFVDSNACRERLSMGVIVAQALQKKFDEGMMQSLIKHRCFIEREVFDETTAIVYNGVGRNNKWHRAYNYPWMSVYYLEWYHLTKEVKCLENSARIMISYYENAEGGRQESPCMRLFEIWQALEKEELTDLKECLETHVFRHADRIMKDGSNCFSEEVRCTQFMFNGKINILCQAYMMSKDQQYIIDICEFLERSNSFFGKQPDYHTNMIAVRYWDLYWFGKSKTYGDTMPQWLSALSGETYYFLYQIGFGEKFRSYSQNVLKNNLCVYFQDGFASAGYLMPYKVIQYSSNDEYYNRYMRPGTAYGHKYDDYSNDQDWALYYSVKIDDDKTKEG